MTEEVKNAENSAPEAPNEGFKVLEGVSTPEEPKLNKIIIEWGFIKGVGVSARISEDSMTPINGVYIRGIFEQCKEQALLLAGQQMKAQAEAQKRIVKPTDSMMAGLKRNYSKIFRR